MEKALPDLFTCMTRMRLDELRLLIELEMLVEGADIGALASRGLKTRGIVIDNKNEDAEIIIVVSSDATETYSRAHNSQLPKIMGAAEGERTSTLGVWQLRTLFADDPVTAVMLMTAALNHWEAVMPDFSVSPAAKAVMKRYYDANVGDESKIDDHFDPNRRAEKYLKALYLGPIGSFDLNAALKIGDVTVNAAVDPQLPPVKDTDRVKGWLGICSQHGFQTAYNDPDKTKRPLPDFASMLKKARASAIDRTHLMNKLNNILNAPRDSRTRKQTLAWVNANREELDGLFANIKNWENTIVPLLV